MPRDGNENLWHGRIGYEAMLCSSIAYCLVYYAGSGGTLETKKTDNVCTLL